MKLFFFLAIISLAAVITAHMPSCNTQEKGIPYMDTTNIQYQIVRDTVCIDPSAGKLSEWDQYEIKITEDSLYVYDAQELITILHARECGKLHSILHDENN